MIETRAAVPTVLSCITREPSRYSAQTLTEKLLWPRPTVVRAINMLSHRQWVRGTDNSYMIGSNRSVWLTSTEKFMDDLAELNQKLDVSLSSEHKRLYGDALTSHRRSLDQSNSSEEHNDFMAASLGRAVLLSEHVQLAEHGWFNGFAAWRSLIEVSVYFEGKGVLNQVQQAS